MAVPQQLREVEAELFDVKRWLEHPGDARRGENEGPGPRR